MCLKFCQGKLSCLVVSPNFFFFSEIQAQPVFSVQSVGIQKHLTPVSFYSPDSRRSVLSSSKTTQLSRKTSAQSRCNDCSVLPLSCRSRPFLLLPHPSFLTLQTFPIMHLPSKRKKKTPSSCSICHTHLFYKETHFPDRDG